MLTAEQIQRFIMSDPDGFVKALQEEPDLFSQELARALDQHDPLKLAHLFDRGELIPFAGHSLGPVFIPAKKAIAAIFDLQREQLHAGHFPATAEQGGNWFDCDIDPSSINAMRAFLGFDDNCEFIYTQAGLTTNLGNLMRTFFRPTANDWRSGRIKICHLATEFNSDQTIAQSILKDAIQLASGFEMFEEHAAPKPEDLTLKLIPDSNGLYQTSDIVSFVKTHAYEIKILQLSDIVFNTGQRLAIPEILGALEDVINDNGIIVGLDLAHTVANRTVDLAALKVVTYAVGCSYKHACGTAGAPFGIYVNKNAKLELNPPLQGWKAAKSEKVFDNINGFNPEIMYSHGARAFRTSNASPVDMAPIQTYMKEMGRIGWDKLIAKSECLTRYMLALLKAKLGQHIQLITPEDPTCRGASLVFSVKGLKRVDKIEELLKEASPYGRFEVDTRKPNNIRITAHYGYTRFIDILNLVQRLEQVIIQSLKLENDGSPKAHDMSMFSERNAQRNSSSKATSSAAFAPNCSGDNV